MPTLNQQILSNNNGTVTLDSDYTEDIFIPQSVSIVIDLNGHRIANSSTTAYTISNMGNLTLCDSASAKGSVYNAGVKTGCIVNLGNGKVTISDGIRFETDAPRPNTAAWYYVVNMGKLMVIEDAVVNGLAPNASTVRNGFYTEVNEDGHYCTLVINGGTYNGPLIPVKNDSYGILTINGGTFESQNECVLTWNRCVINGGTFNTTNNYTVFSGAYTDTGCDGGLTINGGDFQGTKGIIRDLTPSYAPDKTAMATIAVTGGDFNMTIEAAYLPVGVEMAQVDGRYVLQKVGWDITDFAPGGGFANMKRFILHANTLNYEAGGFTLPTVGFLPVAVMGANAVGGISAYYNPENGKVMLYQNGSEASGSIKDLTLVLIGN